MLNYSYYTHPLNNYARVSNRMLFYDLDTCTIISFLLNYCTMLSMATIINTLKTKYNQNKVEEALNLSLLYRLMLVRDPPKLHHRKSFSHTQLLNTISL